MLSSATNNFTNIAANDVVLKFEDTFDKANQFGYRVNIVLASLLAILLLANSNVKKRLNKQMISNRKQNKESFIQQLSLIEVIKSLKLYKFALLPSIGYLLGKYNGAFKFTLGFYKFVIVCKASIAQKLYTSPVTGHLHKPPENEKFFTKSLQGNLGTLEPKTWKLHRSVLARAFTHNSLQHQVKIFEEYAKKLVFALDTSAEPQQISNKSQRCSKQNLAEAVVTYTYDVILHIATGKNIIGDNDETAQFFKLIRELRHISAYRSERPWLLFDISWYLHPKSWQSERIRIKIEAMFAKTLKTAREEAIITDDSENDMAGKSLIELMIKGGFSDEAIYKEFYMFVAVSTDGIPMILKQLLFHLALNPKIQQKCRLEIGHMFEKLHFNPNADAEMTIELLSELQYLEQCIKETIRLYPVLPVPTRMLETPLVLDECTTITRGTIVFLSVYHLHRDPKYYRKPEKFDPDRFSVENVEKRGICEYMGFSEGPRNCIAKKSAILELKVLASKILYNFEACTNNTLENFEAEMSPNRWPIVDPKVELRRLEEMVIF